MVLYYKILTARASVNIAVIKYWGKSDERLKLPLNDSLSGTLDSADLCATTSIAVSDTYQSDRLWLNGFEQDMSDGSTPKMLLDQIRSIAKVNHDNHKVHIVSHNNFPTAAGLASSAAGYACLAFVLGHLYGIEDPTELSKLARRGSGSACRSLFGGFVHWQKGHDHDSSKAVQIADRNHWPQMRAIICVINDETKDVSSSVGMLRTSTTSSFVEHRCKVVVPDRVDRITSAILERDFERFAQITMQDSNQFHAICLDSYPPLLYLNDTSREIIKLCSVINSLFGKNVLAYTFDAGPNACIYLLEDFVDQFISILQDFFPASNQGSSLEVKGRPFGKPDEFVSKNIADSLALNGVRRMAGSIRYLINTALGEGPQLIEQHIEDANLQP